jgi:transcriptional regulator with XRE-family HTH domain
MSRPIEPRIIGEHIRRLRSKRHVSVRAFAAQTGFSPSFISQLENGQVSPSLGSLQKIAETLGVTLGEFFAAATKEAEEDLIVRPPDRRRLDSTWTDAHLEALGSMGRSRRLEPVIAIFGPGGKSGKHLHSNPHEEFALVLKGRVTLTLGDEEHVLTRGDAVTLPAHAPRRWENRGDEVSEILMVAARARG